MVAVLHGARMDAMPDDTALESAPSTVAHRDEGRMKLTVHVVVHPEDNASRTPLTRNNSPVWGWEHVREDRANTDLADVKPAAHSHTRPQRSSKFGLEGNGQLSCQRWGLAGSSSHTVWWVGVTVSPSRSHEGWPVSVHCW